MMGKFYVEILSDGYSRIKIEISKIEIFDSETINCVKIFSDPEINLGKSVSFQIN